ncbi:tRNA-dihydrouridine synthase B [Rhodanobacter lindaniclasticus]
MDHAGEPDPVSVQIAGHDPAMLAEAARFNVANGAQIIDINMGCPAKKVCNVWAGSALLQDEPLVARIVKAVVDAVAVPVTLKIRTGWNRDNRNALTIARIAEDNGIAALAVTGRTRADKYEGEAEYATIAAVKAAVRIPVMANGDITTPQKARQVLDATGADAVMIGRGAQGRPWIFREVAHYLATGELLPEPGPDEVAAILLGHLDHLHAFYGELAGVRIARKHLGWYARIGPRTSPSGRWSTAPTPPASNGGSPATTSPHWPPACPWPREAQAARQPPARFRPTRAPTGVVADNPDSPVTTCTPQLR